VVVGGPSGSGKSTLLGVAAGLLPSWGGRLSGSVTLDGKPVSAMTIAERAERIGFFQQDPGSQFLHQTVQDDCAFAPENLGWSRSRIASSLKEALDRFGLDDVALKPAQQLSGGEQALVLLAALWMRRPRLVLLDEPLANLDPENATRLVNALQQLKKEGCALLVCEHRDELLGHLPDRSFVLEGGKLVPSLLSSANLGAFFRQGVAESLPQDATFLEHAPVAENNIYSALRKSDEAAVVTLDGLSVRRGKKLLLSECSLSLRRGETLILSGPNGSGKTSLLRVLAGLDAPFSGAVSVSGSVRLVGQDPLDQLCRSSVREECEVDLASRRRRERQKHSGKTGTPTLRHKERDNALSTVGLGADLERSPFVLSEGGKRRLAVACGVLAKPDVLLLDEPSAGLDAASVRGLVGLVRDFSRSGGVVICATHDNHFADSLGGNKVVLGGKVIPKEKDAGKLVREASTTRYALAPYTARHTLDPRTGFICFLAALAFVLQPLPRIASLVILVLLVLSYILVGRNAELWRFVRSLALFWILPGLLLLLLASPLDALDGLVRLSILSFLFHRYAISIDGRSLSIALSGWGVPYAAGFAFSAATALVPALSTRLGHIHDMLVLRMTDFRARPWTTTPRSRTRPRFPSLRVVSAMLVPAVVHIWQQAVKLAMNLELHGFHGRVPEGEKPGAIGKKDWLVSGIAILASVGGIVLIHCFAF